MSRNAESIVPIIYCGLAKNEVEKLHRLRYIEGKAKFYWKIKNVVCVCSKEAENENTLQW